MSAKRRAAAVGVLVATTVAVGAAALQPAAGPVSQAEPVAAVRAERATILGIERVSPSPETYGVGIVVRVSFDHDVPKSARDAVTSRIAVTSSKPVGPAAWAWADARTAVYRPKEFWPGHATVTIVARPTFETLSRTAGVDLRWGGSASHTFRTGAAQIVTVDGLTHQATVVRDGETVRTMPVSLGKEGWETRSGVKVLMEKYRVKKMTSESIGAEEEYELDVPYAIRMTNSGEFMHAAPWAASRLGRADGSHGCTNLSTSDAAWLYENHLYGDPVITVGTSRQMESGNGAGGVWNVAWRTWKAGTAA